MEGGSSLRFDSLQNRWFLGLSQGGEPGHILLAFLAVDGGGAAAKAVSDPICPFRKPIRPLGFENRRT
jgi:hypothetical protein